jgi:hypothetical protein
MTAEAPYTPPKAPSATKASGRRLWHSIVDGWVLDEHELALLREAVRTVDLLDALEAQLAEHGPLVESPHGLKANPAAPELRQQRIALARLLAALRLPTGDEADVKRPQRRAGVRSPLASRLTAVR